MSPEQHALLSASAAHRWLHCTRAPRLEQTLPERTSEYAEEGRFAHSLGELKLRKLYTVMKPSEYKKQLAAIQANPIYNAEMQTHTDTYLEYIQDVVHGYKSKPYVAIEQRLDYSHVAPDGFGTGDSIIIGGDTLHVNDFKYGKGIPVSAEDNPQMKLYALGALAAFSLLYDIKTIKFAIIQPRLNTISEWETSVNELKAWGESIKPKAKAAYNGEGEFCAGDWCQFCRAREKCRTRTVFAEEPFDQYHGILPPLITNEEAADILKRTGVIKKWITDLEEWALSELLRGGNVPGWKAVEGRSNRQFIDTDAAFAVVKQAGYDEALLYERKPITLTGVETLLGKKQFAELLSEQVTKSPGKPTLAPESDKREAIKQTPAAAEIFKEEK